MPVAEFKTYRWTVARYDRLTADGAFDDQRVELLEGRIIRMPPQKEPHVAGVSRTARALSSCFAEGYYIRTQSPIHLGRLSKPEPDVAVVIGTYQDYLKSGTPTTALLLVEVSDATLALDRGRKASVYAKFGILDYWVLNLIDRQLEVHRRPIGDAAHRYRFRYADIGILKEGDSVTPLAAPAASIAVRDLLP
jgi:Uma2 family endonuclease